MVKKIVSILLTTSLIMGGIVTNSYATTIDEMYKNAYDSTMKAIQVRNQNSINDARQSISMLPKELDWAIGEFSKKVDMPQQELFESFMKILFNAGIPKDYISQDQVNKAKDLVISFDTYQGNKPYTSAWSSAIDKYQQMLITDIVKLVEKAESTKKSADVNSARVGVNSLLTAKNNPGVISYANNLLSRLNNISSDSTGENVEQGDIYAYKNYVKTELDKDGDVEFKVKYEELLGWQRGGYVSPQHDVDNQIYFVDYFKSGNYYKGMSAYSCTILKQHQLPTGQENYSEIVRLIDGQVLIRVWERGKVEEFTPKALTQNQVNTYKSSTYDQMLGRLK